MDYSLIALCFAFISANLDAVEIIGMSANGANYGLLGCRSPGWA
ncbi:MAG: hypothetical protein ACXWDI_02185 [Nocardioides sp.]